MSNSKMPTTEFLVANEPFAADVVVVAAVAGGSTIIGLILPALASAPFLAGVVSLLPVGITVVAATLIAHGIRASLPRWLEKINLPAMKKLLQKIQLSSTSSGQK